MRPITSYTRDPATRFGQHDGGIREPLLVRWPGKIAPGRVSDLPWAFWDDFRRDLAEQTDVAALHPEIVR